MDRPTLLAAPLALALGGCFDPITSTLPCEAGGICQDISQKAHAVSAGARHACAISGSGAVACWGAAGALGIASGGGSATPVPVAGLSSGAVSVSAGRTHTCALLAAGGARCWGEGGDGQLGAPGLERATAPVDVPGLSNDLRSVAAGGLHSCAVTVTGAVHCWGSNRVGQLGTGVRGGGSALPATGVPGLPPARAVSLGDEFSCALTTAGHVYCWGADESGQAGDGSFEEAKLAPVRVALPDEAFVGIAAGARHACALSSGGAVYCWGDNGLGAVGDGSQSARPLPVAPSGLPLDVTGLSAGAGWSCATRQGSAHCWGANQYGQADALSRTPVLRPGALPPFADAVRSVSCGAEFACAVLRDGGVQCWGRNDAGQLGDGTRRDRPFPARTAGPFGP